MNYKKELKFIKISSFAMVLAGVPFIGSLILQIIFGSFILYAVAHPINVVSIIWAVLGLMLYSKVTGTEIRGDKKYDLNLLSKINKKAYLVTFNLFLSIILNIIESTALVSAASNLILILTLTIAVPLIVQSNRLIESVAWEAADEVYN